jgi:hypothetical protein
MVVDGIGVAIAMACVLWRPRGISRNCSQPRSVIYPCGHCYSSIHLPERGSIESRLIAFRSFWVVYCNRTMDGWRT